MAKIGVFACCAESADPRVLDGAGPSVRFAPLGEASEIERYGPPCGAARLPSRSWRVAFHEAAHACVQLAFGGTVICATIDIQPHVHHGSDLHYPGRAIMALAGDAAESWRRSQIASVPEPDLRHWIEAITDLRGGGCDLCQAVRSAVVRVGRRSSIDDIAAEFRWLENVASTVVRMPSVWAAICEVASALMDSGTLDGDAVTTICRARFAAGFMKVGE